MTRNEICTFSGVRQIKICPAPDSEQKSCYEKKYLKIKKAIECDSLAK